MNLHTKRCFYFIGSKLCESKSYFLQKIIDLYLRSIISIPALLSLRINSLATLLTISGKRQEAEMEHTFYIELDHFISTYFVLTDEQRFTMRVREIETSLLGRLSNLHVAKS